MTIPARPNLPPPLVEVLFREVGVGRCLMTADGTVLRQNPEWVRAEAEGRLTGGAAEITAAARQRACAGEAFELPRQRRHVEGRDTWWERRLEPVALDGGTAVLATAREVANDAAPAPAATAAVVSGALSPGRTVAQLQQDLQRTARRLDALLDHSPLAVIEWSTVDFRISRWSNEATRVFGWTAAEAMGKRIDELEWVHPDDLPGVREIMADMRAGKRPVNVSRNRNLRQDGAVIHCEWYNSSVPGEDGRSTMVLSLVLDVTARKRSELALLESEHRYRELFDSMHEGFAVQEIVCDESGRPVDYRFLEVNAAFERLTGLSRGAVVGRRAREVMPDVDPYWIEVYGRVALTGEPVQLETWAWSIQRCFEVFAYRPRQGCFATIFMDVTQRKRVEEALRKTEERLRSFIEHSPVAVAMLDRQLRYLAVSRRFVADFRLGSQDLVGRSHYDVFPEIPESRRRVLARCLEGAVERSEGEPFHRADGQLDWVRWEIRPWRDSAGAVGGVILFAEVSDTADDPSYAMGPDETAVRHRPVTCCGCGARFDPNGTGAAYVLVNQSAIEVSDLEVCPTCSPRLLAAIFPRERGPEKARA